MIGASFAAEMAAIARSVVLALLPLAVLFMLFQIFLLDLPRRDIRDILTGALVAAAGLFLFLLGVAVGFVPFAYALGEALGSLPHAWLTAPAGLLLGFVTAWGEPAVRVLADQIEEASNGSIRRILVLVAICLGVSAIVGLGLLRIAYGIPLLYLLIPGYAFVIVVVWLSDQEFVAIAIDSGGVATGPLANSFLLALALGTSAAMEGQDPIVHGLGLVALIALAPIVSVLMLGLLIRWRKCATPH